MSATKSGVGYDSGGTNSVPPISPGIRKALRTFKTLFPDLLAQQPGKWVACDGERLLFTGDSQEILYARCLKRGLSETEFVVLCLLPDAAEYID
jgi:hypothetical protein